MAHSGSESDRSPSKEAPRKQESSYDDPNMCLYIGNIDKRLSEESLKEAFSEIGQLDYCFIVYEPHSGYGSRSEPKQSRGYGFAKYKNPEHTHAAKEKMQGVDLGGRRINVEFSKRTKPREPTPGRYLGKTRSPVRKSNYRRSHSRSRSSSSSRHHKRRRHHEKKRRHQRERSRSHSNQYRKRRSSYSRSPRR